jgi:hypothetical protein
MPAPKTQTVIAVRTRSKDSGGNPVVLTLKPDTGRTIAYVISDSAETNPSTLRRIASKCLGINTKGMDRDALMDAIVEGISPGEVRIGPDAEGWAGAVARITEADDAYLGADGIGPDPMYLALRDVRSIGARFDSYCAKCGGAIRAGQEMYWHSSGAAGRKAWCPSHGANPWGDLTNDDGRDDGNRGEDRDEDRDEDRGHDHDNERGRDEGEGEDQGRDDDDAPPVPNLMDAVPEDKRAVVDAIGLVPVLETMQATFQRAVADAIATAKGQRPIQIIIRDQEPRELPPVHHPVLPALVEWFAMRQRAGMVPAAWLTGPAGTGKSTLVEQAADVLGVEFYPVSVHADMLAADLLGFMDAKGRPVPGAAEQAWRFGGMLCLDEVDGGNANVLNGLNMLLASKRCRFASGIHERHPEFYVGATANTAGTGPTAAYVGRCRIDAAFLDRFSGGRFTVDYCQDVETAMASRYLDPERLARWLAWCYAVRENIVANGMDANAMLSPRTIDAGAMLLTAGASPREVADRTFLAGLSDDTARVLLSGAAAVPGAI